MQYAKEHEVSHLCCVNRFYEVSLLHIIKICIGEFDQCSKFNKVACGSGDHDVRSSCRSLQAGKIYRMLCVRQYARVWILGPPWSRSDDKYGPRLRRANHDCRSGSGITFTQDYLITHTHLNTLQCLSKLILNWGG